MRAIGYLIASVLGLLTLLALLLLVSVWWHRPSRAIKDLMTGKTPIRAIEIYQDGWSYRIDDPASMLVLQAALAVAEPIIEDDWFGGCLVRIEYGAVSGYETCALRYGRSVALGVYYDDIDQPSYDMRMKTIILRDPSSLLYQELKRIQREQPLIPPKIPVDADDDGLIDP